MSFERIISPTAFIAANATVTGDVTIGDQAGVWFGAVIRADKDRIVVGAGSNIQDNSVVHTSAGHPCLIGELVSAGHGAILHGCTIRDRVLVGMGAIVMNGAEIGSGSILGAGTVITEGSVVPPDSVVLGVPGKVIKGTTPEQREYIVRNARSYIELAERYRNG
jgi:carbonic anhydrase/acetyltransferase-like protein (isoleucine patch superfamily)